MTTNILTRFRALPRDKADTLLLLATCAMVLAPHAMHAPLWTPFVCTALLLWRGWITFQGNRMPPRWLLLPIAALAMVAVFVSYRTFLGREAGVTMLVLLLTLKLLEMRARRDLYVVVFLSLFLMLATLLNSQSIATAVYMVLTLIVLLATQLTFQYAYTVPPLGRRLLSSAKIVALAVPVMLVLFVLFPRVQGPLWSLPQDANGARTGLSESMSPGNIARLAQSDDIAFRVDFIDPPPPKDKLYWRGVVLGQFDGRTWTALTLPRPDAPITIRRSGTPIRQRITLEPTGRRWLFALEMPQSPPAIPGYPAGFNADLQLLSIRPISERLRYEAVSHVDFALQPNETPAMLRSWLALPDGYNPKTYRYATQLREQHRSPEQIVNAVLKMFRDQPFRYTLEPPLLGQHPVDDFLFSTQAGFCEHYSSAFTVLMRAAGIPARVVTGYQGGEHNPVDGFMTVRQSDAHAWAEVWLPGRGWVRVDPTSAVAPQRISQNLSSVLPATAFGGFDMLGIRHGTWLSALRMNWDALTNRWNQWVLNYSLDEQRGLLQRLGFREPDWRTLAVLMFVIGPLAMGMVSLVLLRNRSGADPLDACYARMCERLTQHGLPRAVHEGPRAYRMRVAGPQSPLTKERRAVAMRFLDLYERAQYAAASRDARASTIPKLKSILAEYR
jgi:transglutaminase-like putative cysteine protease